MESCGEAKNAAVFIGVLMGPGNVRQSGSIPSPQRGHEEDKQRGELQPAEDHQQAEKHVRRRGEVCEVFRGPDLAETGTYVEQRRHH